MKGRNMRVGELFYAIGKAREVRVGGDIFPKTVIERARGYADAILRCVAADDVCVVARVEVGYQIGKKVMLRLDEYDIAPVSTEVAAAMEVPSVDLPQP